MSLCLFALPLALLFAPDGPSRADPPVAVRIAADRTRVPQGERYHVTITIENTGDRPVPVFNVGLNNLVSRLAELEIRDASGRRLGDLLESWGGSRRSYPGHDDWCQIPPKGRIVVGRELISGVDRGVPLVSLPPGTYTLQLVVNRRFFSSSPWDLPYRECGADRSSREDAAFRVRVAKLARELPEKTIEKRFEDWEDANPPGELLRSNELTLVVLPEPVAAPKPK